VANANHALASGNYVRVTVSSGFRNPNDVFQTLAPSALTTVAIGILAVLLDLEPTAGEAVAGSLVIEEGGFVDLGSGRIRIVAGMNATALVDALMKGRGTDPGRCRPASGRPR